MKDRPYVEGQTFEATTAIQMGAEYDHCTFVDCDLTGQRLDECIFNSCTFMRCNLSNAKISGTAFREVRFQDCKLMGLHFDTCNPLGLEFRMESCVVNYASFLKVKIRKTHFVSCQLHETDFTEADLAESVFDHCDLARAVFAGTNLERADFTSASNYSIHPVNNRVRRARFSLPAAMGLLDAFGVQVV